MCSNVKTAPREYVLWGKHPAYAGGVPIKLAGGTRQQVTDEMDYRAPEGWRFDIKTPGERPTRLDRA